MKIKLIEASDNIAQYLECVSDLNKSGQVESIDNIKLLLDNRPNNILTFIMVNDDEKTVATATIILEQKLRYKQPCCHIEDVAVHSSYRGQGYGADMVRFCVGMAKVHDCYKVKLNCEKKLIPFYEKFGFEAVEDHMVLRITT